MRIEGLNNISINKIQKVNQEDEKQDTFNDFLKQALDNVNDLQIQSENYTKLLAVGEVDNVHDVTIASEKAKIALQMTLTIRNKVIDAYNEIMRMQI